MNKKNVGSIVSLRFKFIECRPGVARRVNDRCHELAIYIVKEILRKYVAF